MISNINFRPTAPSSEVTQAKESVSNITSTTGMDDKVFMSESAKLVMEMLQDNQSPEDFNRIMQLQQAIQEGTYVVNAQQIAEKLLLDMDEL